MNQEPSPDRSLARYWRDLPGPVWFSGADLYARFVAEADGPATAVELGAWKGRSTACMGGEIARSGKPIAFYAVDHWLGSEEPAHDADEDLSQDRLFEVFLRNIEPVAEFVQIIRGDSAAAAERFDDGSVDFVYIDASHSYEGVLRDLEAWFRKVRVGGTIAGDDWCFEVRGEHSVRLAVCDFLGSESQRLVIEPGSEPNRHWLQWSFVKAPGMTPSSPRKLWAMRGLRRFQRLIPARVRSALAVVGA